MIKQPEIWEKWQLTILLLKGYVDTEAIQTSFMKVHLEFVKKIILVIKSRSNLRQKTYKLILCETYDLMAFRSFKKSFPPLITSMKM